MDKRDTFWSGALAAIGATIIGYFLAQFFGGYVTSFLSQYMQGFGMITMSPRICLTISLLFSILCVQIFHWQDRKESTRGAMAVTGLSVMVVIVWSMIF